MSSYNNHESNSPDVSKKRKPDDESNYNNKSKRNLNNSQRNPDEFYLKLLLPTYAVGGVIGRGGEKIGQLQKDLNVKMKISKANDLYPGTGERICLINGTLESILKVNEFIMSKIQEKPDVKSVDEDRLRQVKFLIANNSAGSLIGKGGSSIKQIKDESGAFVQISPKQDDQSERVVIVEGEDEKRNRALEIVLTKIAEDQYDNLNNLNYSDTMSNQYKNDGASSNSGNNGLLSYPSNNLILGIAKLNEMIQQNSAQQSNTGNSTLQLSGLTNLALVINTCGGSLQMTQDNLKSALINVGYQSNAVADIINCITMLSTYGLITTNKNPHGMGMASGGRDGGNSNSLNSMNSNNNNNNSKMSGMGGLMNSKYESSQQKHHQSNSNGNNSGHGHNSNNNTAMNPAAYVNSNLIGNQNPLLGNSNIQNLLFQQMLAGNQMKQ